MSGLREVWDGSGLDIETKEKRDAMRKHLDQFITVICGSCGNSNEARDVVCGRCGELVNE